MAHLVLRYHSDAPMKQLDESASRPGTTDHFFPTAGSDGKRGGRHRIRSLAVVAMVIATLAVEIVPAWSQEVAKRPTFDTTGAMVGEQLPDFQMLDVDGGPVALSRAWMGRPVLLVTSSLTCPKSRSMFPDLVALAEKHKGKISVAIVYVIEAHPLHDLCPYKGVEDVTPENRRDGILHRQPTTLPERLKLAKEFKERMNCSLPIYVDTMEDRAWKGVGGGPNMAILVREGGTVIARQGWFEPEAMDKLIAAMPDRTASFQRKKEIAAKAKAFRESVKPDLSSHDLMAPATRGDLDAVAALLKTHPDLVTYIDEYQARGQSGGKMALQYAAESGHARIVQLLIDNGADLNAQTEHGASALHLAVLRKHEAVVDTLIRNKADLNLRARLTGSRPVETALLHGHATIATKLIKAGATQTAYAEAALGKLDPLRERIGKDPTLVSRPDGESHTLLDYAASAGQMEVAKYLLSQGAIAGRQDKESWRELPLHWAIRHKHPAMLNLLLEASNDASACLYREASPLHMAVYVENPEMVGILLNHHADTTARDTYSRTPLHRAASQGHTAIVKALVAGGADVNVVTKEYNVPCGPLDGYPATLETPLHMAAAQGYFETVKELVAGRANLNAKDAGGRTPLDLAKGEVLKKYLRENGGVPGDPPKSRDSDPSRKGVPASSLFSL